MSVQTSAELRLDTEQQLKAVANDTRARVLTALEDGPASQKQLAELLGMTHGKVGHHVRVLRDAGLIEVVAERPVRAMTERFYGLTFDRLRFAHPAGDRLRFALSQASREALPSTQQPFDPPALYVTVRTSNEKAAAVRDRLEDLVADFESLEDPEGEAVFGFTAAIFLTDTPRRPQA